MAFPSVTYTFSNGTSADATQVNTNFTDLINGLSDTTKDISINAITSAGTATLSGAVVLSTNVTYPMATHSMYQPQRTSLVWASVSQVTVKTGRYFIGGKVYNNGSDITWTWVASGQNGGLDTGSEASATWYYLYGVLIGGAFGAVVSTTAPTNLFDTDLSGTAYDTNVYLGAFYNNASSNIMQFWQAGSLSMLLLGTTLATSTGNTSFNSKTIIIPTTAAFVIGRLSGSGPAGFESEASPVSSGSTSQYLVLSQVLNQANYVQIKMPIDTAQTIWLKSNNAGITTGFLPLGWVDKWL